MSLSPRLSLPFILSQQAQKHVTVNEAVRRLDAVVQLSVVSRTVTAQPTSPVDGDCYILPSGKSGAAWGAMANGSVAAYQDGAWTQITPKEGFGAWVQDTNTIVYFDGSGWVAPSSSALGLGAAANQAYETGAFTPSLTGSVSNPTITYALQNGVFTRIGRYVWAEVAIGTDAVSGGSGNLRLSIPFVCLSDGLVHSGSSTIFASDWATNSCPATLLCIPGAAYCQLYQMASADARGGMSATPLTVAALSSGAGKNYLFANILFKV